MNTFKKILIITSLLLLSGLFTVAGCYCFVEIVSKGKTFASTIRIPKNKVGLLLGTSPVSSYTKKANPYYYYRIDAAVKLYKSGKIDRILISGDNSTETYSEPDMMKNDLVKRGVPSNHIYLDFVISDNENDAVKERLRFLCHTSDGFAVAKYDLENRGPGDFFGSAQHGLPTLRVADLVQDTRTLKVAQEEAKALLAVDPNLAMPQHRALSDEVDRLFATAGAMN